MVWTGQSDPGLHAPPRAGPAPPPGSARFRSPGPCGLLPQPSPSHLLASGATSPCTLRHCPGLRFRLLAIRPCNEETHPAGLEDTVREGEGRGRARPGSSGPARGKPGESGASSRLSFSVWSQISPCSQPGPFPVCYHCRGCGRQDLEVFAIQLGDFRFRAAWEVR